MQIDYAQNQDSFMVYKVWKGPNIEYVEIYDVDTGIYLNGCVTMYGNIKMCSVYQDGTIHMTVPIELIVNRQGISKFVEDLQLMNQFLSEVNPRYRDYIPKNKDDSKD